mmetsp:Transcript_29609/g.58480  ORF Transcript_29609/g.58480 Transcript_29609/m.58480 type:complete len:158 (+) Transcript_29609:2031-2504(+)
MLAKLGDMDLVLRGSYLARGMGHPVNRATLFRLHNRMSTILGKSLHTFGPVRPQTGQESGDHALAPRCCRIKEDINRRAKHMAISILDVLNAPRITMPCNTSLHALRRRDPYVSPTDPFAIHCKINALAALSVQTFNESSQIGMRHMLGDDHRRRMI